jgi:hypothetical protein
MAKQCVHGGAGSCCGLAAMVRTRRCVVAVSTDPPLQPLPNSRIMQDATVIRALTGMDLNLAGTWASIISLVLTFINTLLIVTIKRRIAASLTLQPLLERLQENSAALNQCLTLFDASIDRFNAVVAQCEVNARTARRRLGMRWGFASPALRALLKATRSYNRERTRDNAQEVYNLLGAMIQYINNLLEERRISG